MSFYGSFPVVIAGVAAVMDLRTAKVDNGWILFSLAVGSVSRIWQSGAAGLGRSLMGALLPVALLGGLFVFRMLGPGDIKLFSALGGIMGPGAVGKCILVSFFLGAGISMAILISNGNICRRFLYFLEYFNRLAQKGERKPYYRKGMSSPENFHFTVPVFLSVVLYAGGVY